MGEAQRRGHSFVLRGDCIVSSRIQMAWALKKKIQV